MPDDDDRVSESGEAVRDTSDARDRGSGSEHHELARVVAKLEQLVGPGRDAIRELETRVEPAWRRVTLGEPRLPVSLAVLASIALEIALPDRVANRPRWLFAGLAVLLL